MQLYSYFNVTISIAHHIVYNCNTIFLIENEYAKSLYKLANSHLSNIRDDVSIKFIGMYNV